MINQRTNFRFGGPLTPVVKNLMIINGGVFLIQQLLELFFPGFVQTFFALSYSGLVQHGYFWQLFTYMFLHGGWLHIIFNLIALWMFGGELENLWGSKYFLKFYLVSGVGAGVFIAIMNTYVNSKYGLSTPTIGASGAIYAILLGYGFTWPNREVLLYFILPIKVKFLVLGFGLFEFFGTLSSLVGNPGRISHVGHLGGLLVGFLILRFNLFKKQNSVSSKPGKMNFFSSYLKKSRLKKKKNLIEKRIKAKKIIDEMLGKIAREGMSSLTTEEKKLLNWARKNYYPDKNDILH